MSRSTNKNLITYYLLYIPRYSINNHHVRKYVKVCNWE